MKLIPTVRLSLAFLQLRVFLFIAFCENVVEMMTDNPNFAMSFPALADVTAAINTLRTAAQVAMDRSRTAIAERNQAWGVLLGLMRPLAAWVQAHCQNNRSILISSGFLPVKSRTPIGPLAPPDVPFLKQGTASGMMAARTRRVNGAYAYCWRLALASAPTVYVQTVMTTSARTTFEGLTPGQFYNVELCAIGSAGEGGYSATVGMIVV